MSLWIRKTEWFGTWGDKKGPLHTQCATQNVNYTNEFDVTESQRKNPASKIRMNLVNYKNCDNTSSQLDKGKLCFVFRFEFIVRSGS